MEEEAEKRDRERDERSRRVLERTPDELVPPSSREISLSLVTLEIGPSGEISH